MRKPYIAGNWKMNQDRKASLEFAKALKAGLGDALSRADVAVFPPYPYLAMLSEAFAGSGVEVGAQEMHEKDSGAFTGAVSASMIKDCGCAQVLIGHSERRQYFGEDDAGVNRKLKKALDAGLKPVVCVGETLDEREGGDTEKVVLGQLEGGLAGLEAPGPLVLAYEPVWAIGTGRTATPAQAQAVHALIRGWLGERFGAAGAEIRVLYGGSVKPDNIAEIMKGEDVDGALVGGASLKADAFLGIVKNAL